MLLKLSKICMGSVLGGSVFRVTVYDLRWPHKPKPLNRGVKPNVGIKNRNFNPKKQTPFFYDSFNAPWCFREILYKGNDQIAWKQLWRPEGRQLSDLQQFFLIIVNRILLNLLICLLVGLQTGFSSF